MTCDNCFMGEGGKKIQFFKVKITHLGTRLPKNWKLLDDIRREQSWLQTCEIKARSLLLVLLPRRSVKNLAPSSQWPLSRYWQTAIRFPPRMNNLVPFWEGTKGLKGPTCLALPVLELKRLVVPCSTRAHETEGSFSYRVVSPWTHLVFGEELIPNFFD